jgi:LysM repeat protein
MRNISLYLLIFTLAAGGARAQDAATQQEIDKLAGRLDDIIEAQNTQAKQLTAMEHEISDLRDKLNAPPVNNYAAADDLQKLATQVQEIDHKRQEDKDLILGKIEELAKISTETPHPTHHTPAPPKSDDTATTAMAPQNGYDYKVKPGDSLLGIIKEYKDKGVKVTLSQVLKANPGLTAKNLEAGQKIFIPDPSLK